MGRREGVLANLECVSGEVKQVCGFGAGKQGHAVNVLQYVAAAACWQFSTRTQTFSACGNLFPLFPTVAGWAHLPKPACGSLYS